MTRVDEPNDAGQLDVNGSPVQFTKYTYDTLNNLVTVNQGVQTRTFQYDSLSRLKQANNPESGIINYVYDSNGNLTSKTDARQIATNYVYGNLNRVKTRSYSNEPTGQPITQPVAYTYDNLTNAKGKLIKVTNGTSTTEYTSFDILGRVQNHKQTTDGNIYNSSYVYNLSGALIEEVYPSGRVVKNTLNVDGDLAQVQSKKLNGTFQNYANAFIYTSAGAVSSLRLGNGKFENTTFNSRLQPIQIGLGSFATIQNLLKLDFDYGGTDNNGNVKSQTITTPTIGTNQGFTAAQTYAYDSLNRLKSAVEVQGTTQNWKQTFTFDRYGNRTFDTANNNTTTLANGCPVANCNPIANPTNNKLIGTNYDSVGNTTQDANGQTFVYDAENKQVQVNNASGIVGQYFYDGDGKRIKKIAPLTNETTIFVYDASGKMVAEYSTVAALEPKVSYLTNDHLGSPRITSDSTGTVISRRDFMPFGEEIPRADYGGDNIREKFATYERDGETGLDFAQARMFGSGVGRFTSPDNFLNDTEVYDPTSWNLYAYVRNNPLNHIDPSGEIVLISTEEGNENGEKLEYKNGKLYSGSFVKGKWKTGGLYKGDNAYATKVLGYLNTLKGDKVLGERLGTLERSSKIHSIQNVADTDNRNDSVEPESKSDQEKQKPTGSTIYFNADKGPMGLISSNKKEELIPILGLAHELMGHAYDNDQGTGRRKDEDGNIMKILVGKNAQGLTTFTGTDPYDEMSAVQIENLARKLLKQPLRTWYGDKIPNPLPKTNPTIFITKK